MPRCKCAVKRLDPESRGVLGKTLRAHQRHGSEPPYIGVMQRAPIIEIQPECRIPQLRRSETSIVDEKRSGKTRLHDQVIARVEIGDHELCTTPGAEDSRVA